MIKTYRMLIQEFYNYSNPADKIRRMVKDGGLIPVTRGIYETNRATPGYCLAPIIYGPSYLSFAFALAYHGLIPEAVYQYTSATIGKRRSKQYDTPFGVFTYRDIPESAYPAGLLYRVENGYSYFLATPEKALCDQLYQIAPLKSQRDLEQYLFEDLRMDTDEFMRLNQKDLSEIAGRYHARNHKLLTAYIKRRLRNASDD